MGIYTTLHLHPADAKFKPDETLIRRLLSHFGVQVVEIASGEKRKPWWKRIEEALVVRQIVTYSIEDDVFYQKNIPVDQAIELWLNQRPASAHFLLGGQGIFGQMSEHIQSSIPADIANGFVPWDTCIHIGPWSAHHYDTGKVTARGSFSITKSNNGNPHNLEKYREAFQNVSTVKRLLQFLQNVTNLPWKVSISMS